MATTNRDYYELLGIERNADDAAIKKAFRRLARELHPDVSDHPEAEARFREVTEAYEVLTNSETRALYDRFGHDGLRSGGFRPTQFDMSGLSDLFSAFFGDDVFGARTRGTGARGADVAADVDIDLAEAAKGTTAKVPFQVAVSCDACGGDGIEPGTDARTCGDCGGAGQVRQVSRSVFGEFVRAHTCPTCNGRGLIVEHPCKACRGGGRVLQERSVDVDIPAGIHDGQRIRLSGEGHAGVLGGRSGDVYVLVHIRPHESFVREGNDIFSQVDLTISQASLGVHLTVETLDGPVDLELPAGVQPGELRVLRGRGMPVLQGFGRGDHRVLVNVLVPRRLSEEQRRLLEEFDQSSDEQTYRTDESFFDKLKSAFH
jgi:molecular chaperone DnaJ